MTKSISWMVFFGPDSSHVQNCKGGMVFRLKDAKKTYDGIDTDEYGSRCKHIVRMEFGSAYEPATKSEIVKKNY